MRKVSFIVWATMLMSLLSSNAIFAQQDSTAKKNPFSASCDLMSRYIWRGTDFGDAPSIQPSASFSKKNFTIGAWGAIATSLNGYQETDIYVSYAYKFMSLTVTDYFFPSNVTPYKYFDYNDLSTGHVIEASLAFTGTKKIPLTVMLATNVYGADSRKINSDGSNGGIQYSTYAEIAYAFKNINVFMGTNLTNINRDNGETGYYGNYMGVVNLGLSTTKNIKITEQYSLPLSVSLITNPQAENIYLVAGFSF